MSFSWKRDLHLLVEARLWWRTAHHLRPVLSQGKVSDSHFLAETHSLHLTLSGFVLLYYKRNSIFSITEDHYMSAQSHEHEQEDNEGEGVRNLRGVEAEQMKTLHTDSPPSGRWEVSCLSPCLSLKLQPGAERKMQTKVTQWYHQERSRRQHIACHVAQLTLMRFDSSLVNISLLLRPNQEDLKLWVNVNIDKCSDFNIQQL